MIRSLLLLACYLGVTTSFRTSSVRCARSQSSYSTATTTSLFDSDGPSQLPPPSPPSAPYSQEEAQVIQALLPSPLIDSKGNIIDSAEVIASLIQDQRVGLYFAAGWCEDCKTIEFMLEQYRSALRASDQPIQLIYVPCDKNQDDQLRQMQEIGLELGVPLGETADKLKHLYGVWPDVDVEKFGGTIRELIQDEEEEKAVVVEGQQDGGEEGDSDNDSDAPIKPDVVRVTPEDFEKELIDDGSGRRSGIPAIVVLDNTGGEFAFLNMERDTISAMADWPLDDPQGKW
jgi:hypothetical protein